VQRRLVNVDPGHHVPSMSAIWAAFRYTLFKDRAELTMGTGVAVAASPAGRTSIAGMRRPPSPLSVIRGASAAPRRAELTV